MKDLISVIVPVYNVAAYLPRCLDSILGQDHQNLEIFLIDDGSQDLSGAICDDYARRDSRVRVIHQANAGAAAAKNAGLRQAKGEYLSFVDSDDFLEPGAYSHMLRVLNAQGADLVQCAFRDVYRSRTEEHPLPPQAAEDALTYLCRFPDDWTCSLLWNKLYRRALFEGILFEEGHKIDDEYFTYQGVLNARKVVRDPRIVYNYRRRASGVMRSAQTQAQLVADAIDAIAKRRQKVLRRCPQLRRVFDHNYLDALWYLSGNSGNTRQTLELLKCHLRRYLREPGRSLPPRWLWGKLLRLYLLPVDALLASIDQEDPQEVRDCFP